MFNGTFIARIMSIQTEDRQWKLGQ